MALDVRKAFRLSKEQDEILKQKVAASGLSESEYLRLSITDNPKDYPEIRSLLSNLINEVNKIGVDIDEIVHSEDDSKFKDSDKLRLIAYMRMLNQTVKGRVKDIGNNKDTAYR